MSASGPSGPLVSKVFDTFHFHIKTVNEIMVLIAFAKHHP